MGAGASSEPGESEPSDLLPDLWALEIYKLAVEMADRVSARRGLANVFFVTLNTTLISVLGFVTAKADSPARFGAVCGAGIAVSACWLLQLRVYRRLNSAKFAVINKIEADYLPIKPFTDEWAELMPDDAVNSKFGNGIFRTLWELGNVERIIPLVFGALYIIMLLGGLLL